jgi:transcription-repair coupling factor (superfamily II helicase)
MVKPTVGTMLVPRPTTARVAGTPLRDQAVLRWAEDVVEAVLGGTVAAAAAVAHAATAGQPVGSAR